MTTGVELIGPFSTVEGIDRSQPNNNRAFTTWSQSEYPRCPRVMLNRFRIVVGFSDQCHEKRRPRKRDPSRDFALPDARRLVCCLSSRANCTKRLASKLSPLASEH